MAARVHDSVLQTLALIQRHAHEPRAAGTQAGAGAARLAVRRPAARRRQRAADRRRSRRQATSRSPRRSGRAGEAGDCPVDPSVEAHCAAAREAMTNAAKFAGVDEVDVYAEVADDEVSVFVRDRGEGFDRAAVPDDRRGLVESIEEGWSVRAAAQRS